MMNRIIVKKILEEYIHSSYYSLNWSKYHLYTAKVLSYSIEYENYWESNHDGDAKRQMIYVNIICEDGITGTLRLSARTVKKFIRSNYNIQQILLNHRA